MLRGRLEVLDLISIIFISLVTFGEIPEGGDEVVDEEEAEKDTTGLKIGLVGPEPVEPAGIDELLTSATRDGAGIEGFVAGEVGERSGAGC